MKNLTLRSVVTSAVLHLGIATGFAQTTVYLYTGSETTITLNPGTYNILAYSAQGGTAAGSGGARAAEIGGTFSFLAPTTLTLLVGSMGWPGGGGGGGSFVAQGVTPLVVAGGGGGYNGRSGPASNGSSGTSGGNGYSSDPISDPNGGGSGGVAGGAGSDGGPGNGALNFHGGRGGGGFSNFLNGFAYAPFGYGGGGGAWGGSWDGGGGGGGYSGGGGGGGGSGFSQIINGPFYGGSGGGGGSFLDPSATDTIAFSGVRSGNGEINITLVPEPATLALGGLSLFSLMMFQRQRRGRVSPAIQPNYLCALGQTLPSP